jgi:membrane fusion protein, heavy metal efflux system
MYLCVLKKKYKVMKINILAIIFLIIIGCNNKKETTETLAIAPKAAQETQAMHIVLDSSQLQLMHIELGKPTQLALEGGITANGKVTILANAMADASCSFRGTIDKFFVKEGQPVKKGQLLMELIAPELLNLQQDYWKAKSELSFLTQEVERQRVLNQENVGARKNLQEVESKISYQNVILKSNAARLKLAGISIADLSDNDMVSRIQVVAPISGYLEHFPVNLGTTVAEGAKLAHIKNLDDLHADVFLYERDLQSVRENQLVHLKFVDPNIPEVTGKIEFMGREIDPIQKTILLHVTFDPPKGKMVLPEMQVIATIQTQNRTGWAVPEAAIVQENDKFFVFKADSQSIDGKFWFKKHAFTPTGTRNGFIGVGDYDGKSKWVIQGANVLESESKKEEMNE